MFKLYSLSAASLLVLMVLISPTPLLYSFLTVKPFCQTAQQTNLWLPWWISKRGEELWVSLASLWRFSATLCPRRTIQSPPHFDTSFPLWFVARLRLKETRKFSVLMRTDGCCRVEVWADGCFFFFSPLLKGSFALYGIGCMHHNGLLMTSYHCTFPENDLPFFSSFRMTEQIVSSAVAYLLFCEILKI